jgi:hypothetical protein
MGELEKSEFDFTRLSNRVARQDAQLSTVDLVANLRADVMLHWTPPDGGHHGALNHVVIHGLDVTVPLGVPRLSPVTTIPIVLDDLTVGGGHSHFGIELIGRRLEATDIDWAYGSGPTLRGEAQDLALVICGRTVTEGRLQGDALV